LFIHEMALRSLAGGARFGGLRFADLFDGRKIIAERAARSVEPVPGYQLPEFQAAAGLRRESS
jgi:hypothetical protein